MVSNLKTNAIRILDKNKIEYKLYYHQLSEALDGLSVASLFDLNKSNTYKTLVTQGKSKNYYVFMVPVAENLDLKKAANVVGEKSVEMIPSKDLLSVTGYIHGGCSPIGMKKSFPIIIQTNDYEKIIFSGGKIGLLVELRKRDFFELFDIKEEDVIK